MVVRIRLARFGRKRQPIYNIVISQAKTARNSKPMEVIGTYDPIPKPPKEGEGKAWKDIKLDTARAKYWLGVGAQPSEPAWRLLSLAGLLEPRYRHGLPTKKPIIIPDNAQIQFPKTQPVQKPAETTS